MLPALALVVRLQLSFLRVHLVEILTFFQMQCRACVAPMSLLGSGEAECASLHGAKRRGAISLLVLVVFGRQPTDTSDELVVTSSQPIVMPANASDISITRLF